LASFDVIYKEVLNRTVWGVDFYMLCDRDSIPAGRSDEIEDIAKGRLRVLPRYHLENYFLDEEVIAKAFGTLEAPEHWLCQPSAIRQKLREAAEKTVSYAAALATAMQVREEIGNVDLLPRGCHEKSLDRLRALFVSRLGEERQRLGTRLTDAYVENLLATNYQHFNDLVRTDSPLWKIEIPGRPILERFAGLTGLESARLKRIYIDEALTSKPSVFGEIFAIFDGFSA
jgi:hypothetical protein